MSTTFRKGIGLIQAVRHEEELFRTVIQATEPKFQPFPRSEGWKHLGRAPFLLNTGDVEVNGEEDGDKEDAQRGEVDEGIRRNEEEYQDDNEGRWGEYEKKNSQLMHTGPSAGTQIVGQKRKSPPSDIIYVNEVSEMAKRARTRELPGNYPFSVQKTLIANFTKEWSDPAYTLSKTVHALVLERIKSLISKHFSEFGQGRLERKVKHIMEGHLNDCRERAEEMIKWLLKLEDSPSTLNKDDMAAYKDKFLRYYKDARDQDFCPNLMNAIQQYETVTEAPGIAKIVSGYAEAGVTVKPRDLAKGLSLDPMDPYLAIMAEVCAYFQLAYIRFVDTVARAVDYDLVRSLGDEKNTLANLYKGLGINGVDGERICRDFAGEGREVAARRADLQKKLERLETASEELLTIGL